MSIINNSLTEIGDSILIQLQTPIFGVIQLQSFTDDLVGETSDRYFKKEFSYSTNGVFFSDWIPLTDADLQQVVVEQEDAFYINYRYTRQGIDPEGTLEFNSINLIGQFINPVCENYFILTKSIFKDFFCHNPQHAHLCAILTNKLFQSGILPEYVERNQTQNPQVDDEDFLAFWGTVCCFYSLIILLAEKIEKFYTDKDLLLEYLKQQDFINCSDISLGDLNYLKKNLLDEIRQRGTFQIFVPKDDVKEIDGEFLRLICYNVLQDELIVNLLGGKDVGWWLGRTSPCYKGISFNKQVEKTKTIVRDIYDVNLFNTYKTDSNSIIESVTDGDKQVLKIFNVPYQEEAGIGIDVFNQQNIDFTKAYIIDPSLDYEITFWIKPIDVSTKVTFGCRMFSKDNQYLLSGGNVENGVPVGADYFFLRETFVNEDGYSFVRGIIYNEYFGFVSSGEGKLNTGFGINIKSWAKVNKIIPYIIVDSKTSDNTDKGIYIWDLKIRPLVKGSTAHTIYSDYTKVPTLNNTPLSGSHSTCFLTTRNLLSLVYKNNNQELNNQQILSIVRNKLIPYNSILIPTQING